MALNVLVVEDEWVVAMDHAETLRGADFEVVGPCGTVEEALSAIEANHVDAALLDLQLRDGKSYPIAERLRQLGIPFVFLSGYDERVLPASMRGSRMLLKPVERGGLLEAAASLTRAH